MDVDNYQKKSKTLCFGHFELKTKVGRIGSFFFSGQIVKQLGLSCHGDDNYFSVQCNTLVFFGSFFCLVFFLVCQQSIPKTKLNNIAAQNGLSNKTINPHA